FNVRSDATVVEVLVTEGRVRLDSAVSGDATSPNGNVATTTRDNSSGDSLVPALEARQRAIVSISSQSSPPQIATLTAGEIARVLAWQHRLLDFQSTPLSEIVAEFNRRNGVQLVLMDDELASIRMSVSFRSDNVDGFLRLLDLGFGTRAERRGTSEILLSKKN